MFATVRRDIRMIGRAQELRVLRRTLDEPGPHALLLRGPFGVGRSRLLDETLDGQSGVVRVAGRPSVYDAPSRAVNIPADARVVAIDDADHLDVEAAEALGVAVAGRDVVTVLVVAAGRPVPVALAAALGTPEVLDVPLLSDDEIDRLLDALLDRPLSGDARRRLRRLASGNPGYARLLVEDALARGQLREHADGVLRLTAEHEPAAEVVAAVGDSLDGLSPEAMTALCRLVLAGSLPLRLLGRIASPAAFSELQDAGAAYLDRGVAHVGPLVGEVVEAGLSEDSRGALGAELIEAIGDDHPDAPLVPARWHLDVGPDADVDVMLAGARVAHGRCDHALAERLATAVRASAPHCPEAELLLADVEVTGAGRTDWGLGRYGAIAASTGHPPERRSRAVLGRAVGMLIGRGDPIAARQVAEAGALAHPTEAAGVEAGALAALAGILLGDVDEALAALAQLRVPDSPRTTAVVAAVEGLARSVAGDLDGAQRLLGAVTEEGAVVEDDELPIWAVPLMAVAAVQLEVARGDLGEARRRTARELDHAQRLGRAPLVAVWHAITAQIATLTGDLELAERSCVDALVAAEPHDPFGVRAIATCQRAIVAAQRGAVHLADDLIVDLDVRGVGAHLWLDIHRGRALAWSEFAGGQPRSAAKLAIEAGELALGSGAPVWAALAFNDAVRFGHAELALAGAELAEARCGGGLPALLARHARAAASGEVARGREIGDVLYAAGLRLRAAEAWLAAAEVATGGDVDGGGIVAERLRRRAGTVLGSKDPLPVTAGAAIVAAPTDREREVAALVATGVSSACVAVHLGVSTRTVDNHVTRALRKLGAEDRQDLAWLLGIPELPAPAPAPTRRSSPTTPLPGRSRPRHRAVTAATARRRTRPQDRAHV